MLRLGSVVGQGNEDRGKSGLPKEKAPGGLPGALKSSRL